MLGVQKAMNGNRGNQEQTVSVLVAATEIPVGTRLTPENVAFRDYPVSTVSQDAVTTAEQYADRSAKVLLLPNDVVTMAKLTEPGVDGLSVAIPMGWRVVTVKVTDTHTHSNLLRPGDRVDVMVTYKAASASGKAPVEKNKTLLEYVQVFSTGNKTISDAENQAEGKVTTVGLMVTPEQMPYLLLAEKKGTLSLAWRNVADDEHVKVGAVDERLMEELQGTVDDANFDFPRGYGDVADLSADGDSGDVHSFLDQQTIDPPAEGTPAVVEEPAVADDPPKPMWKMVIYRGEDAETVEMELPEPPVATEPVSLDAGQTLEAEAGLAGERSSPIGSLMKRFKNLSFGN